MTKYSNTNQSILSRGKYTHLFICMFVCVCVRVWTWFLRFWCIKTTGYFTQNHWKHIHALSAHVLKILLPCQSFCCCLYFISFSSTHFVDAVVKSEFVQFYGILMASPVNNWKNNKLRNSPLYRKHIRRERITYKCRPLARQMQWLEKRWQP